MATKKRAIGAIIKLDGESAFRNSISNCRNSVSAMKSEMNNIIKSYDGSANSLQALTEMQAKYSEIQQRAHEQAEKMATAYDKSAKKQDEVKQSMQDMKEAYVEAQKTLERMQESGTATAEAMEEQEKATDAAYQNYLQYESAVEKAEARTAHFQKALADAKGEEIEAGEAIKKYSAYIAEAQNSTDGMASSIDGYGNEIKAAGDGAKEGSVGVSMFTGALSANVVTAGLEKAIGVLKEGVEYAVQVGSAFEESQSKVKAISGVTADEMAQIEAMSKNLGRTTKFSASEVSAGFSEMSLVGWSVQQQLAAMPGTVNLAIAAEMSLSEASQTVAKYLNAFGLGADYAAEMADILTTAQSKSGAYAEDFGEAWKNCAANMNAAGQSIQTTTAILEALANQGKVASEAGTSLRAVTRDLISKMVDGKIAIGDTSVQVADANGNFRDLIDILADVENATDGMGTAARSAALSAVFTDDSITAINMTLKEGVDNIRNYKSQLEDCEGAASDMADTMNDNLQGSFKNLGSAAEGLGNAAFNYIGGPLRGVVDGVTGAINDITDVLEPQVTEVTRFVDLVVEASDKINQSINTADSDYTTGMSNAQAIQSYIDVIEKARSKTSLTEFEVFQLNDAVKNLSGNIPELNDYIDNTGDLLGLSSEGFSKLKKLMSDDYKKTLADAIVTRRNAYAQAMADAEIAKNQAQSALEASQRELNERADESLGNFSASSILSILAGNKWELFQNLKPSYDALDVEKDAKKAVEDTGAAYEETKKKYEDYIAQFPKLQEELGITQDENGKWITTLSEAGDEAEKTGKKASDANDDISDSSEKMEDTVRKAVSTYIEETQKLTNADPSDIIRDQLAAAAAEVQSFKDTIQGNLSSFSLFGDRSSLIDAYTSTNRDEMKLNMSWQLKSMQDYTKELDTLQKRGVSTEFIDYLTSQGQAGLNYVHSLALASDAELQQFQTAFNEYNGYITGAEDNVKKLLTDYAQGISAGIADGYDSWHQFGIETTAGLFDAIDEATAAIKNGSITGDITNALQVVLQNRADQIETEKEAQKRAHSIQVNEATKTRDVERKATNDDLRVTVNVTTQNIVDGKMVSENSDRRAKVKRQITGRR